MHPAGKMLIDREKMLVLTFMKTRFRAGGSGLILVRV